MTPPSAAKDVVRMELTCIDRFDKTSSAVCVNSGCAQWEERSSFIAPKTEMPKQDEHNRSFKKNRQVSQYTTSHCVTVFSIADWTKNDRMNREDNLEKNHVGRQNSEKLNHQNTRSNCALRATHSYPCEAKESAVELVRPFIAHSRLSSDVYNEHEVNIRNLNPSEFKKKIKVDSTHVDSISKPLHIVTKLRKGNEPSEIPKIHFVNQIVDGKKNHDSVEERSSPSVLSLMNRSCRVSHVDYDKKIHTSSVETNRSGETTVGLKRTVSSDYSSSDNSVLLAALPHYWSRREKMRNAPCPDLDF